LQKVSLDATFIVEVNSISSRGKPIKMSTNTTDFDREYLMQILLDIFMLDKKNKRDRNFYKHNMRCQYEGISNHIIEQKVRTYIEVYKDHPACKKYLWMLPLIK
jgi:hypothetical protein